MSNESRQAIIDLAASVSDLARAQQEQAQALADLVDGVDGASLLLAQAISDSGGVASDKNSELTRRIERAQLAVDETAKHISFIIDAINKIQSPIINLSPKLLPPDPAVWKIEIFGANGIIEKTATIKREAAAKND